VCIIVKDSYLFKLQDLWGLCCNIFILENSLHDTARGTDKRQIFPSVYSVRCYLTFIPRSAFPPLYFSALERKKKLKTTYDKTAVHRVFTGSTENENRGFKEVQEFLKFISTSFISLYEFWSLKYLMLV